MEDMKLGLVESHFADIVWTNEPIHSRDLVKLCDKELDWKKSTTYTVLRKLCERGLFQNQDGMVTSLISKKNITRFKARSLWKIPLQVLCRGLSMRLLPESPLQQKKLHRFVK